MVTEIVRNYATILLPQVILAREVTYHRDLNTLEITDVDGGETEVLSIIDPFLDLGERELIVKDYSEHRGLPGALEEAELADPIYTFDIGPWRSLTTVMRVRELQA